MEEYADKVLFILTNYGDKIRPAIKSRCTTYTFNRVSPAEGAKHLHRLVESCGAPLTSNRTTAMMYGHEVICGRRSTP